MMEKKLELNYLLLAENNLARAVSWTLAADQKAWIVLTFVLFSLGYLFTQTNKALELVFALIKHQEKFNFLAVYINTTLLVLLFLSCIFFLFSAGYHLISALGPRVKPHSLKKSLFFFGSISQIPCDEFIEEFLALNQDSTLRAICDQTFNIATVVTAKYKNISDSIWWFKYGVLLLAAFSFLCQLMSQMFS
jgi:hypothetical protein